MSIEEIKVMRKSTLSNSLNKSMNEKAIEKLNEVKSKHSKVLHLKHEIMNMKKYLKAHGVKSNKEEKQLIFKLRSRVTDLKMNYQGIYDFHDCDACGIEDESQKHILECPTLISFNEENEEITEYEKIFEGTIQEKLDIARLFQKNMEIKDSLIIK